MARKRDFSDLESVENIEAVQETVSEGKKFVALRTVSIIAGARTINLVEGEEVKDISDALAQSLINSNLIKHGL